MDSAAGLSAKLSGEGAVERVPKFFFDPDTLRAGEVTFSPADSAHLARVLRVRPGEQLLACDGQGNDYRCVVQTVSQEAVCARATDCFASQSESTVRTVLYQCVAKGDKMDSIVQKAVELGVSAVVPVLSQFCVVKLGPKEAAAKQARWQLIARQAAIQSERSVVPLISLPISLTQALAQMRECELALMLYGRETQVHFCDQIGANTRSVAFLIGPEGGFSEQEVQAARAAGVIPVLFGQRILRTETISCCVLAIIQERTGNL